MDYIQKKYLDIVRLKLYSFMIYHVVAFWTKEMMYKSVKISKVVNSIGGFGISSRTWVSREWYSAAQNKRDGSEVLLTILLF